MVITFIYLYGIQIIGVHKWASYKGKALPLPYSYCIALTMAVSVIIALLSIFYLA